MPSTCHKGGSIKRIYLKNFMTYKKLELFPTMGLNLLIGPNGSGKSSIVCAICLGLGGKATFTGRHLRLAEFISHGSESAFIELELDNPSNKNHVKISREIRIKGSSVYRLNDRPASEAQIEKAVSMFNIQVNNLCQFLPQEKVSEFSRMDSKQLLESMQQAVGDQDMYNNYKLLVNQHSENKKLDEEIKKLKDIVTREKSRNESMENQICNHNEYTKKKAELDILKMKRPVCEYILVFKKFKGLKDQREVILEQLKDIQAKCAPILNEIEDVDEKISIIERETVELEKTADEFETKIDQKEKSFVYIENQIEDERNNFKGKLEMIEDQAKKIDEQKKKIIHHENLHKEYKKEHENMKSVYQKVMQEKPIILDKYSSKRADVTYIKQQIVALEHDQIAIEKEYEKLNDSRNKKLKNLKAKSPPTFKAMEWLNANQNLFKKKIFEPIMLLIDVPDKGYTKYVENIIPFDDMIMFLCEDVDDARTLTQELRVKMNLAINFALVPKERPQDFVHPIPVDHLRRQYHFVDYIKNVITAPDAVISYLCANYNLHKIPIGNASTDQHFQKSNIKCPFNKYFISEFAFTVKKSRYGAQNESQNSYQIREKGILMPTSNLDIKEKEMELQNLKSQLAEEKRKESLLLQEMESTKLDLEKLREVERNYVAKEDQIKNEEARIFQFKRTLDAIKNQKIDINMEKEKMKKAISQLNQEKCQGLAEVCQKFKKIIATHKKIFEHRIFINSHVRSRKELEQMNEKFAEDLEKKNTEKQEITQKQEEMKVLVKKLLNKAQEVTGITINAQTINNFTEKYGKLPHNLDDLDSQINDLNAKLGCIPVTDADIIKDFQRREKQIKNDEATILSRTKQLEKVTEEIKNTKASWLPPLEALVSKISHTFGNYFEKLGCVGEVVLKKGENADDFDKYGLSILVKFRDSQGLNELSAAHHSGGECSVSTIVFILSLQELTEVPFRCVDEINQGMDSVNERKIFELVAASAEKSSQYFLLTPKLLQELDYSEGMQIHIIHNGPALISKKWNIREFIRTVQDSSQ